MADEYGIAAWIAALLDPAPVTQPEELQKSAHQKAISPPPKFKFTAGDKAHLPPPNGAATPKVRGRPRGASPTKSGSPTKASVKKPTKKQKEAAVKEANDALQTQLNGTGPGEELANGEKVKVNVESKTEAQGGVETTTTNVQIEMPKGTAELPLPDNPEEMIATAKKMVEEAHKLDGANGASSSSKRKVEQLDDDDDEGDDELQPAKKARLVEQKLKTERVRNRALVGVAATLAIGYVSINPYTY